MLPAIPHKAPYCASFERWLGRPLPALHRRIITALEHARQTSAYPRFLIHDDGTTGSAVINLLLQYIAWLDDRLNPQQQSTLLITRTTRLSRTLSPSPRFVSGSLRTPLSVWGQRYSHALILNADRANTALRRYDEIQSVTRPVLPDHGILIIHGNARRWGTAFSSDFLFAATSPECPVKALAANPLKERRRRKSRNPRPTPLLLQAREDLTRYEKSLARAKWLARDGRLTPSLDAEIRMWTAYVHQARRQVDKETAIRDLLADYNRRLRRVLTIIYEISPHIPRNTKDTDTGELLTESPVTPYASPASNSEFLGSHSGSDIETTFSPTAEALTRARAPA